MKETYRNILDLVFVIHIFIVWIFLGINDIHMDALHNLLMTQTETILQHQEKIDELIHK